MDVFCVWYRNGTCETMKETLDYVNGLLVHKTIVQAIVGNPQSVSKCVWRNERDTSMMQAMLKNVMVEACHQYKSVRILVGTRGITLEPTFLYAPPPPENNLLAEKPKVRNTECIVMGDPLDQSDNLRNVILLDKLDEPGMLVTRQSLRDTWSKTHNQEYNGLYMDGCRTSNPGMFVYKLFDNRYVWNAWNVLACYPRCLAFALHLVGRFKVGSYHARLEAGVVIDREENVYDLRPVYGDFTKAVPMPDTLPNKFMQYDMFGRQEVQLPMLPLRRINQRVPCVVNNRVSASVLQNMRRYVELNQRNVGALCVDWSPNEHDLLASINDMSIPVSIRSFMLHCFNMLRMTRQPARRVSRTNRVLAINGIHAMSVTPCPVLLTLSFHYQWNEGHQLRVPREHLRFFESIVMSDGYYIRNIMNRGQSLDEVMEFSFVDGLLTRYGLTMQNLMDHEDSSKVATILFINREVISTLMFNLLYPNEVWLFSEEDIRQEYGNSIIRLNYGVVSNISEERVQVE